MYAAAAAAKSLQSCPTLCNPMDFSLPGSSIHGIFQARVLEWGAIAFSGFRCIVLYKIIAWTFNLRTFQYIPHTPDCVIFVNLDQLERKKVKLLSRVRLFATPWTSAYQVPPSMGFSRQEYWSGVPSPSLGLDV